MLFLPAVVAALNILIIIFPRESLAAARDGIALWAGSVLPGVLPFVIGANLLMALGVVNMLGVALGPFMRAAFRVPGVGGFALAIGLVSGYPIGAKVVCEMRLRGDLSRTQAQRLAAFSNNAGPLFILGAVAAGMFGSIALGYFLLATHYMGALTVGFLMRFYGRHGEKSAENPEERQFALHIRAYRAMAAVQRKDGRGFGQIFGQSVVNAVETMLLIGGFIVLFSVVAAILGELGLYAVADAAYEGLFVGLVEMTNGLGVLSQTGINRGAVALAATILGFGGASIMFQSISFIGKTDINVVIFALCKAAHGAFSAAYAFILYPLFSHLFVVDEGAAVAVYGHGVASRFVQSAVYFAVIVAGLAVLSFGMILWRGVRKGR